MAECGSSANAIDGVQQTRENAIRHGRMANDNQCTTRIQIAMIQKDPQHGHAPYVPGFVERWLLRTKLRRTEDGYILSSSAFESEALRRSRTHDPSQLTMFCGHEQLTACCFFVQHTSDHEGS